jgi:hypothetical protein
MGINMETDFGPSLSEGLQGGLDSGEGLNGGNWSPGEKNARHPHGGHFFWTIKTDG